MAIVQANGSKEIILWPPSSTCFRESHKRSSLWREGETSRRFNASWLSRKLFRTCSEWVVTISKQFIIGHCETELFWKQVTYVC
jgi:hypothetical protein